MPTVTYPIRREPLYTITKEPCKRQPRYVLRHDSRLPWRYVFEDGHWTVWTRADDTPGSQNNYVIADNIQDESEARLIAAAPMMLEALKAQHDALDWCLAQLIKLDPSFMPTKSPIWKDLVQGNATIKAATEGE